VISVLPIFLLSRKVHIECGFVRDAKSEYTL
jgi:hypothetical protein